METRSGVELRWNFVRFVCVVLIISFPGSMVYADECDDQLKEIESQFDSLGKEMSRVLSKLDINSIDNKFFSQSPDKNSRLINSADEKAILDDLKNALIKVGCDIPSKLGIDKTYDCASFSARVLIPLDLSLEKNFGGFFGFGKNQYMFDYYFAGLDPVKRVTISVQDGIHRYSVSKYMKEVKNCDVRFTKGINFEFFDALPNPYTSSQPEPKNQ